MSETMSAVEDFLTCRVCLETFKEPVSLGCNHSFCSSCLENFWAENTCKTCPVCRRKSSRELIDVNFALKELIVSLKKDEAQPKAAEEICSEHPRAPALFCLTDARALCPDCEISEHREHTVVSVEEAVSQLKTQLQSELKPLTERREQASALQRQYEEVRLHSEKQAEACARLIRKHFERLHRFLQREEELRLTALSEEQSRQAQTMDSELEKVRELLSTLNKNISTVEQQLKRERMDFIRQYSHSTQKTCSSLLPQPTPRLGPGLLINQATVLGNMSFKTWEKMRSQLHYTPVLLDPNTAARSLYLSEDLSSVRHGETEYQQVPDNPERFSCYASVLGSEGWSSGSHQWDVEVGDHPDWNIGVVKESVGRKGKRRAHSDDGLRCLFFKDGKYYDAVRKKVKLQRRPQKIRVRLDYDEGKVSFYNTDDMSLICVHTDTFEEKMFPLFSVGRAGEAKTRDIKILSAS